ncbi:dihydrolipoamide acetyltransferase family protein, partial [Planotetraspora phitsanulokensis]|uniref:dihydrolipoamide acetyltransferase family protein n=1 Tax=Planotetraspora phitsanulokensis TaxID=575192 RepID=UPI00194E3899
PPAPAPVPAAPAPVPAAPAPVPAAPAPVPAAPAPVPAPAARVGVLAKPPVRKLAKDLGVDLTTVEGTGPQGSITRDDVQSAVGATAPATGPTVPLRQAAPGREERIPVRGVRRATAQAMVASAFTAPHVTEFLQVDVTETMAAVRRLRQMPDFAEVKVSPLLLVARALLTAVRRHPMANSTWTDEEIIVRHYVNLGIAAATDRGLIVPNIKDAQDLSLPELAGALNDLTERARSGKATPAELTGGTITITNVGVFGIDAGTPILNPGEAAILALGQIRDMPWVVDGQLAVRKVTTLALSFDHRLIDGEIGSYILRDIGAMLEDPLKMLAWG